MLYQAHRGVQKEYPENTMAAIRAAKEQGYDIIEIDPAVTKDGVIVLMHDDTIGVDLRPIARSTSATLPFKRRTSTNTAVGLTRSSKAKSCQRLKKRSITPKKTACG